MAHAVASVCQTTTLHRPGHGLLQAQQVNDGQAYSDTHRAVQGPSGPSITQLLQHLCILPLQISNLLLQLHHLLRQLLQPVILLLQVSDTLLQLRHLLLQLLLFLLVLLQAMYCQNWALVKPVTQLLPHRPVTLHKK